MAITAADVLFKLSVNTGPGDSTAQPTPTDSLGGFMASTQIVDATTLNLFDKITGDENLASTVDYRCMFVHNSHATLTWENVKAWISAEVAGGASVAIGLDPAGVVNHNAATAMAARLANELAVPAGVTFTAPTTKTAGLAPGNVGPGQAFAIWVRRTAANTVAVDADGCTIHAEGDTPA